MKDVPAQLIEQSGSPLQTRNAMREYLRARVLACLQR